MYNLCTHTQIYLLHIDEKRIQKCILWSIILNHDQHYQYNLYVNLYRNGKNVTMSRILRSASPLCINYMLFITILVKFKWLKLTTLFWSHKSNHISKWVKIKRRVQNSVKKVIKLFKMLCDDIMWIAAPTRVIKYEKSEECKLTVSKTPQGINKPHWKLI